MLGGAVKEGRSTDASVFLQTVGYVHPRTGRAEAGNFGYSSFRGGGRPHLGRLKNWDFSRQTEEEKLLARLLLLSSFVVCWRKQLHQGAVKQLGTSQGGKTTMSAVACATRLYQGL